MSSSEELPLSHESSEKTAESPFKKTHLSSLANLTFLSVLISGIVLIAYDFDKK